MLDTGWEPGLASGLPQPPNQPTRPPHRRRPRDPGWRPQPIISQTTQSIRRASAHGVSDHGLCAFDIAHFRKNLDTNELKQHFRAQDTNSSNICYKLCSNFCFLSEKCAREGRCQGRGAWETAIHAHFHPCGLFFVLVLEVPFFLSRSRF